MTWMHRFFVAGLVVTFAGAPASAQTPDPPPAPVTGGLELRLQTASNVSGGGALFGLVLAPGVTYDTEGESLMLNLSGGAGYLVSPSLAVGADAGVTLFDFGEATVKLFSLMPYVKFVTGLPERANGFFVEPGIGVTILDPGDDESETLVQLTVWGGGHFFLGRSSTAFVVGPYVTYLKITSAEGPGDDDDILIGLKFGITTYLL